MVQALAIVWTSMVLLWCGNADLFAAVIRGAASGTPTIKGVYDAAFRPSMLPADFERQLAALAVSCGFEGRLYGDSESGEKGKKRSQGREGLRVSEEKPKPGAEVSGALKIVANVRPQRPDCSHEDTRPTRSRYHCAG